MGSYEVSRGQSTVSRATIQDLKKTNEAVAECREGSSIGLVFQAGTVDWNNAAIVTIIDASFAQEEETNDDGNTKHHRSQTARLTALVSPTIFHEDVANCHVISFASATDKRVCNSTLQAEGRALIAGSYKGDRVRAIIADLHVPLNMRNWERESANARPHLWLSDCKSLLEHLH